MLGLVPDFSLCVLFLGEYIPTHTTKIWRGPNEFYFVKMVKNVVFIIPCECPND